MDTDLILEKAIELHRSGQLDAAEGQYKLAIEQSPNHADALYGLGTVLCQKGRHKDAVPILEQACKIVPDAPEFVFNLALALNNAGDITAAKKVYLRAAELANGNPQYLYMVCKKLLELNLPQQCFQHLVSLKSTDVAVGILMAKAQGAMNNWASAISILENLSKNAPNNPNLWRELSLAAARGRNFKLAISAYNSFLSLKTIEAVDLLALADLYLMAHNPELARETIDKAIGMGEQSAQTMQVAAKCARLEGNYDQAQDYIKIALEKNPNFGEAWQLHFELASKSELSEISEQCRNLAESGAGDAKNQTLIALTAGRAFEKLENYSEAIKMFDLGNATHKNFLTQHQMAYDPIKAEQATDNIIKNFTKAPTTKSQTNSASPIFILGMARSGSTLVEKILTGLNGVEAGGENEALEHVIAQFNHSLSNGNTKPPLDLKADHWQNMAEQYWLRTPHNSTIITDKMPHNFRHIGFILAMFPNAPIIYTHRDPRDVCLSIYARFFPDGHNYACDLNWIAHFYGQSVRLMKHWQKIAPNRILEVKYENLVAKPEQETKQIADFCKLKWTADCLNFHKRKSHSYTFSELQVRKPLNTDGIDRWKNYGNALKHIEPMLKKILN